MTIAEKLRFLADRTEDEKEFYVLNEVSTYRFKDSKLMYEPSTTGGTEQLYVSVLELNIFLESTPKLKPQWEFTEDEKVILRNLPDDFQWIARDEHTNGLFAYTLKPTKHNLQWGYWMVNMMRSLECFNHLFQCIQWSDSEPCEFRKYL